MDTDFDSNIQTTDAAIVGGVLPASGLSWSGVNGNFSLRCAFQYVGQGRDFMRDHACHGSGGLRLERSLEMLDRKGQDTEVNG